MADSEDPSGQEQGDPRAGVGGLARRLTLDQRRELEAATPDGRDGLIREMRGQHLKDSLDEAVDSGRLTRTRADSFLERFKAGEDTHRLQRELRRSGVLQRRMATAASEDLTSTHPPTATEQG